LEGDFLTDFKMRIKNQLNSPESETRKSKDMPKNLKALNLPKTKKKSRARDDLITREPDTQAKETSRFGTTTPVENLKNPHDDRKFSYNEKMRMPVRLDSNQSKYSRASNHENTLSLSFIANAEDRSYIIYDSNNGPKFGDRTSKPEKHTRQRIERY
jgi:hypothetical protein